MSYFKFFVFIGFIGSFFFISVLSFRRYRNNFSFSKIYYQLIQGFRKNIIPDRDRKSVLITILIPTSFFLMYFILGLILAPKYLKYDFFGADIDDIIYGWTSIGYNENHKGSHPLSLLFTDFIGSILKSIIFYLIHLIHLIHWIVNSTDLGFDYQIVSKITSVIVLNAFFASLAIFLSFIFFRLLLDDFIGATLLTLIFGFSMSQLVFGILPEHYALAGVSIIVTYILLLICLRDKKLYAEYWVLTGLLTFGVTITNFSQSIICFSIAVIGLQMKNRFVVILKYILLVISLAFILSLIQYNIFPHSKLFFIPSSVTWELRYTAINILNQPFTTLYELGKHFLIVNFISPSPFFVTSVPTGLETNLPILGFFKRSLDYNLLGLAAIVLWLSIFISGLLKNLKMIHEIIPFFYANFLGVLFNIIFHSVYGVHEMFLYTCHFTFLILALATNRSLMKNAYYKTGLIALIFLMGANNLLVIKQIITL